MGFRIIATVSRQLAPLITDRVCRFRAEFKHSWTRSNLETNLATLAKLPLRSHCVRVQRACSACGSVRRSEPPLGHWEASAPPERREGNSPACVTLRVCSSFADKCSSRFSQASEPASARARARACVSGCRLSQQTGEKEASNLG